MTTLHPQLDPGIRCLIKAHEIAEAALVNVIEAKQSQCRHPVIGTTDYHSDMRMCLRCGREEQAPRYHSFLFTLTERADRLFVPLEFNVFISHRLHPVTIHRMDQK